MIIEFWPRFTYYWKEIRDRGDSDKLSLPGASRLLLWNTIEPHSREELQIIVIQKINAVLETLCDEFYGTERLAQEHFSESVRAIMVLIRNNLYDIIVGLNGEWSESQTFAWLISMDYELRESWIRKNSLFWTNVRIFIAACFRTKKLQHLMLDLIMCEKVQCGTIPFSNILRQFNSELSWFSRSTMDTSDQDDLYQEWCIVLWKCIQQYTGQNYTPFRMYFLKALKNKKIDLERKMSTDKRKIERKISRNSWESYLGNEADKVVATRYVHEYHTWLCRENDGTEDDIFIPPDSVGKYFPEVGKSIKKWAIEKWTDFLFDFVTEKLFEAARGRLPGEEAEILKTLYPVKKIGLTFLKYLSEDITNDDDWWVLRHFLQKYMQWKISFSEGIYKLWDMGDLQEKFFTMCQEIIRYDYLIQLWKDIRSWKQKDAVPF